MAGCGLNFISPGRISHSRRQYDQLKIIGYTPARKIQLCSPHILQPVPGVGGHCIAVDPWFIIDSAPEQARLIRAAREVNDDKSQ
jgi:UDP-N-acetyl-D-mannosaminuronate dehydrogenase